MKLLTIALLIALAAIPLAAQQQTVQVNGTVVLSVGGVAVPVTANGTFTGTYVVGSMTACEPFTEPLSAPLGTPLNPANWSSVPALPIGGGTIVQNAGLAEASAVSHGGAAVLTSCPQSNTPSVQFAVNAADGLGALQGMLVMSTTGNGYTVALNNGGVNQPLYKCAAGVCAPLGVATCGGGFTASHVFRTSALIVPGASIAISVYRDGLLCGTVNDTTKPWTAGYSGLIIIPSKAVTGDQISQVQVVN